MTTHKYWIGVIAADHVGFCISSGLCAFTRGQLKPVAKLSVGDRFAYYSPKTGVADGDPVQAFTALGTVTGETPFEQPWADTGLDAWVRAAEFQTGLQPAPVRPLLETLSFVTSPRHWGMAFRRGQFEVSQADFAVIEAAMASGPQDG